MSFINFGLGQFFTNFNLFIFHFYSLGCHDVALKLNLSFIKMILFEFGKNAVFPQLVQHLTDSINVSLACILSVDQNVIQVNNYKNVKFFGQDFIDVTLKVGWCI